MIDRENWKLIKKFLSYRDVVMQNDPATVRSGWICLRHTLQWADKHSFKDVVKIRPTLPDYLLTSRNDGKPEPISPVHMKKILAFSKSFFEWLRIENSKYSRFITPSFINSLQIRRSRGVNSRLVRRQFWTLEDVEKVIKYPTDSIKYFRDKAALAFIYMSAMRGGAFVSMPIRSVDLERNRVYQFPEWGVKTKNSKAAETFLLPIPSLRKIVEEWDAYVRKHAKSSQVAWYTVLDHEGLAINPNDIVQDKSPDGRRSSLYQGLQELCKLVDVEWKSPHKVRHGHGVYGLKHARTMAEYKAVSQNMTHDTVGTTDRTYSVLLNEDVGDIIGTFKP